MASSIGLFFVKIKKFYLNRITFGDFFVIIVGI